MTELIYSSVTHLTEQLRRKAISSVELTNAYLSRIETVNPKLNAVVQLAAETVLKEAAEADKRKKEMEDVANVQRLRKKKAENAKAATNTVNQVVTHDSRYLDAAPTNTVQKNGYPKEIGIAD